MGTDYSVTPLKGRESSHGRETDQGITLDASAVDGDNTPTTTLRKLLVLGKITASGKYAQYDALAEDGTEVAVGLLKDTVDMIAETPDCVAVDKPAVLITHGEVNAEDCPGLDLAGQAALTHIIFRNPLTA